jgi:choline dehydrogenase-like flavoprotein
MSCEFQQIADYIVVGAGSASCVVAARLAQAGNSVIVIEAGPDTSLDSDDPLVQIDLLNIFVPLLFPVLWRRFSRAEESTMCGFYNATQTLLPFVSTNQNGAYYPVPRSCGAGGCVSHHAMQDGMGSLQIYDNIATLLDDDAWNGENAKRVAVKMEHVQYDTPDCEGCCGKDGWLSIVHTPRDPLSNDLAVAIVNEIGVPYRENWCNPQECFGVGSTDTQINVSPDPNLLGGRSYVFQDLLVPVNEETGLIRVDFNTLAFELILEEKKDDHCHDRCHDKCHKQKCHCCDCKKRKHRHDKCKEKKWVCKGVKAYNKAYLQEFEQGRAWRIEGYDDTCEAFNADDTLPLKYIQYLARKEVIVGAGTWQTPQLLQLSGIGPRSLLQSLNIPVKLDRPGVGSNILDHCEMAMAFEVDPNVYLPAWQATILLSLYGIDFYQTNYPAYLNNVILPAIAANPGALDSNTGQIVWDWWSSGSVETVPGEQYPFPDVHVIPYETYLLNLDTTKDTPYYPGAYFDFYRQNYRPNPANPFDQVGLNDRTAVDDAQYAPVPELGLKTYLSFLVENLKPLTFPGTVRIQSRDPRVAPIIEENLYQDVEGLRHMAKMALQVRQMLANNPWLQTKYGYITEFQPGPLAATEDQIIEYIQLWTCYGHHMCGTCAMGKTDCKGRLINPMAVLDKRCRVVGVEGLRVADCSVYPTPEEPGKTTFHAYNTSRGAYVVGELVSEFILGEQNSCVRSFIAPKKRAIAVKDLKQKDRVVLKQRLEAIEELKVKVAKALTEKKQE